MFTKAQILKALEEKKTDFFKEEIKRLSKLKKDDFPATQIESFLKRGEEFLKTPAPLLEYQKFQRYFSEIGDRKQYEKDYFEYRERLLVFSVLAWLFPKEEKWILELENVAWAICSEPCWCVPAHLAGVAVEQYDKRIDLFSSETGFALAEMLYLNEDKMAKMVVDQVKLQVKKRIFDLFLDGHNFYFFEVAPNNWCSVCSSAIGGAALYLVEDKNELLNILHRVLDCSQNFMDSFGDDGICIEGNSYWSYGVGFFICFADLLKKRTNGKLNIFASEKAKAIVTSQHYFYITEKEAIPFSDASRNAKFRMGISSYVQEIYKEAILPDIKAVENILTDHCFRFCLALRDLLWYRDDTRYGTDSTLACYLPNAEWFISRTNELSLVARGGNNGESHNHNDVGSFVCYRKGKPIFIDLGAGLYNAKYFSNERYNIFINSSLSHNVAIINEKAQAEGGESKAENVKTEFNNGINKISFDIDKCYRDDTLKKYNREITHNTNENFITLIDKISFTKAGRVTEVFVSEVPFILEKNRIYFEDDLPENGLFFDDKLLSVEMDTKDYENHQGKACIAYLAKLTTKKEILSQTIELTIK